MRMFSTPEGDAGFALKGDDIVSVFKHPSAPYRNVTKSMLDLATSQGGRRLDAFDTVLPKIYSQSGFRAVARLPFNDQYAPEGWDREHFKAFNGGRPDVVFMAHDPQAGLYSPWDAKRINDYDEGAAHQRAALAEIDKRGNVPAEPGPGAYGSGQLIRMRDPTTVWHGTPHTFQPTRAGPLGEFDISKMNTGEGAQAYGLGPYVAGNEKVARDYRNELSGGVTYQGQVPAPGGTNPREHAVRAVADAMEERGMTPAEAIEHMRQAHEVGASSALAFPSGVRTDVWEENQRRGKHYQAIADALGQLDPNDFAHNKGNLYQAELHIDPEHLLDWDTPLSEHSPYVRAQLHRSGIIDLDKHEHFAGEDVYNHAVRQAHLENPNRVRATLSDQDEAEGVRKLLAAGIPGIRYLDAGSRRWGFGTHNYVVFDPRTVNIVRRNGLPAMVAAGADALRDHKRGTS